MGRGEGEEEAWLATTSSQQAFGAKMTSYQCRCDVMTSHRR